MSFLLNFNWNVSQLVSDFTSNLNWKCDVTSCSAIQRHNWRSLMSAQPPLGLRNIGWNSLSPTRETSRTFGKRNSFVDEVIFSTCLTIDSSLQVLVYRWIPLKKKSYFFQVNLNALWLDFFAGVTKYFVFSSV